jgi:WD40 repeat protein
VNKCEPGPRRSVKCLCFSPDGSKLLAVGSDDHMTAFVFKVGDGKLLGSSTTEGAWSVAWNNETEFAAFGGDKGFRYNLDKG